MNIHDLCYEFINTHIQLFELAQYDKNHSINLELLENFVNQQTCSKKYFGLLNYIYKQSTYIGCDTFIDIYSSNIKELNERFADKELILLFPYLEVEKSNYFFSLYFLYLYNSILSKKINYIFPYKRKDKKTNVIDIGALGLTKEPLFIVCDDFLYSGGQLSITIANLPIVCSNELTVNIYPCIVGMTNIAASKFTKDKLRENMNIDYTDTDICYNVIFPEVIVFIEKNLKTIIRDKIIADGLTSRVKVKDLYDYIADNDMYIMQVQNDKLYAVGQFANLYHNLNNTLIYLFFKYPDLMSTVLTMCILEVYSNMYTVSLDMLPNKPEIIKNYPSEFKNIINKFEITNNLFNNEENLEEIKQHLRENTPIDINKFKWIQKCGDFSSDNVKYVSVDSNNKIELIRNLNTEFNTLTGSLCNDSITPFYKNINAIQTFKEFSNSIKSTFVGGRKHFYTTTKRKTIKRNTIKRKTMKRKTIKRKKIIKIN
jgi:hypothetical protein